MQTSFLTGFQTTILKQTLTNATFSELISQNKSVTIHQRNLQLLATDIFKIKNELNPRNMKKIFPFKNVDISST